VTRVAVEARAKLNLGLVVGPRRRDGYHELATVFQSISLADTLMVEPRRRGLSLEVRHEDAAVRGARVKDQIPTGRENLVIRAAELFNRTTGLGRGAHFTLVKRIPAGAGLGGGSADAAAALVGLGALYGVRVGRAARLAMASTLGSDVPFALRGGTALGFGRGEILVPLELERPFRALIAVPSWRVSTARAYARIDRRKYSLTAWRAKLRSAQLLGRKQLRAELALRLGNAFEEVLGPKRRDFFSLRERLLAAGASEVRMTGSGSAVFGVLEPGTSSPDALGRFTGKETLFRVRAVRTGQRLTKMP
jgi:4-diphosphocytidyl-2-C-methyl-D-erythritol kinase